MRVMLVSEMARELIDRPTSRPCFILPPSWKPLVDALMADPNPEGEAFLTRAALNGGNILYQRSPVRPALPASGVFDTFPWEVMDRLDSWREAHPWR